MEIIVKQVRLLKNGPANETIFILGPTGRGKTTLVANLLSERSRFVIFDAKNDYYPEFFGGDVAEVSTVEAFAEALQNGQDRIIFRVASVDEAADELLDSALGYLNAFQFANIEANPDFPGIAVSLDELNRFAETHSCPQQLREEIERGRDYKITKIFGAQWFNSIPTWMRSSFSEIYTFQYSESIGLKRLEDYGLPADEVKALPPYVCLHTGKNGVEKIRLVPSPGETKRQHANKTGEEITA